VVAPWTVLLWLGRVAVGLVVQLIAPSLDPPPPHMRDSQANLYFLFKY